MNDAHPTDVFENDTANFSPVPPPIPSISARDLLTALPIIWAGNIVLVIASTIVLIAVHELEVTDKVFSIPITLGTSLLGILWGCGVAWFYVCRRYGKSFRHGFALFPVDRATLWLCTFLGIISAVVGGGITSLLTKGDSYIAQLISTPYGLLCFSLLLVTVPPLEEIYYRGFLFSAFTKSLGSRWALVIVTVWFTLIHCPQLVGDWAAIPVIFLMAFIWTFLRHKTGSITPSIITHLTYNLSLVIFQALLMLANVSL